MAMSGQKLFTLAEANGLIPKFESLLRQVQLAYLKVKAIVGPLEESDLTPEEMERRLLEHPELRGMLADIQRSVKMIQETGAVFKGFELGLIDFPALIDGKIGFLCWQFGEGEIRWWHEIESGFAGRRPLPGVPPREVSRTVN